MRRLLLLACLLPGFLLGPAYAQGRYGPAQLEELLAPIARYSDQQVFAVLAAARHPEQVAAAAGSRVDDPAWHASVRSLLPYPELLERMAGNPRWTRYLAEAAFTQRPDVLQAVQRLRERASAAGSAPSGPNGPPSPAAQMQQTMPQVGRSSNSGPSPAQQMQQQIHPVTSPYAPETGTETRSTGRAR